MARYISYSNTLPLLPLAGIVAGLLQLPAVIVFALNLSAFSVLVHWIGRSIDAISVNTGRLANELLKGSLGNAVELMVNNPLSLSRHEEHRD